MYEHCVVGDEKCGDACLMHCQWPRLYLSIQLYSAGAPVELRPTLRFDHLPPLYTILICTCRVSHGMTILMTMSAEDRWKSMVENGDIFTDRLRKTIQSDFLTIQFGGLGLGVRVWGVVRF